MNIELWTLFSQLILAVLTFIGIMVSMYFSHKALREVQKDRELRHLPYLAFEPGGFRQNVEFVKAGKSIPGLNKKYVSKVLEHLPDDVESIRLKSFPTKNGHKTSRNYARLKNYGLGPAFSTSITWIPEVVWIGSDKFSVDQSKLSEPIYSKDLNKMPSLPEHIRPLEEAELSRIPTFIEKDFEKKVTRVDGFLEIIYKDIFGIEHQVLQSYHVFTGYTDDDPYFHVTFMDVRVSQST